MATLVNKLNREVKVIIPNMREFSTFYSDKEGVLPMFFKRDWAPVKEEHWRPSEEQIKCLRKVVHEAKLKHNESVGGYADYQFLRSLLQELIKQL